MTSRQKDNLMADVIAHVGCHLLDVNGWFTESCRDLNKGYRGQCWKCRVVTRVDHALQALVDAKVTAE